MTMRAYVEWMRTIALPWWQERAQDERTGLFFEKLNLDGSPDTHADIRLRTHMRQVYVFAHCAELGLMPREQVLSRAVRGMDVAHRLAWAPDGKAGWVHSLDQAGTVVNAKRDLYDHAFVLHALAWVAKATGETRFRTWIDETLEAVDTVLAAKAGGWAESDAHELPRRQNPHMHLLEASLALYETSDAAHHLARAAEIVSLFRTRFFDETLATMREFFGPQWQVDDAFRSDRLDPGHMAEWVWLLRRYERAAAQPVDRLTEALFIAAERLGMDDGGFLLDEVDPAGKPVSEGRRLWPQTEYLKACTVEHEMRGDATYRKKGDAMATRILSTYIGGNAVPALWIDRFDLKGGIAVDHVPASILYHLLAPVVEYLRLEEKGG